MSIIGDLWNDTKDIATTVSNAAPWGDIFSGLGVATTIGSTLYGQHVQSQQNKESKEAAKEAAQAQLMAAQAQHDELYAEAADIEKSAQRVKLAAQLRQGQIRQAGADTASTANSNYAASGVVSGVGSAGVAQRHIGQQAEADAYTTMMNANDNIETLNAQAAANRRRADVVLTSGQYAAKEGTAAAVTAANLINQANWTNTVMGVANSVTNWVRS